MITAKYETRRQKKRNHSVTAELMKQKANMKEKFSKTHFNYFQKTDRINN